MGGRAMLDTQMCANFVFLYVRIFGNVAMAFNSLVQPSGFSLIWDWGGTSSLLLAASVLKDLIAFS
jgi:hypothetical protein